MNENREPFIKKFITEKNHILPQKNETEILIHIMPAQQYTESNVLVIRRVSHDY